VRSLAELQQLIDGAPFGQWWTFVVEAAAQNVARIRLPAKPQYYRSGGVLQGACAPTLADVAVWIALAATVDDGADALTSHLATEYLAPARGDLVAGARIVKLGRRLAFGVVETRNAAGDLVAYHHATYVRR
jgi:uncharacterized protein (TIGR00369 family)